MALEINDLCILCGECVPVCPENCIFEGKRTYRIDTKACTECDECIDVCPVDAIEPGPQSKPQAQCADG